jgi:ribokinase
VIPLTGSLTPGLVAVVGSANLDVVIHVRELAAPGETVLGEGLVEVAGGKGLNQALAVARSGRAALVGCVGQDDAGRLLMERLTDAGVRTVHVREVPEPTGRAFIQVAATGENSIVVAAGANAELSPADVRSALDELRPAAVLAQLEVSLESVEAAAAWASEHGARFVLNPSPVRELSSALLSMCDPLVLNAHEGAALLGLEPATPVEEITARLAGRARSVVVTDGPRGAHLASSTQVQHVAGLPVDAVDTTGAGDEFVGRLTAALSRDEALHEGVATANRAAAHVVTVPRQQR